MTIQTINILPILRNIITGFFIFFASIQSPLAQQLNADHTPIIQERLFIHTDKTFYITGEIVWFKIYDVDNLLNKPLDLSKVAYVEILNGESKPIAQSKVKMENSTGDGSILLPSSIPSGKYILRGYTQWMKNFEATHFFEQPLTIINTAKDSILEPILTSKTYNIQFFPEGGKLIEGLPSKVAFKITDQNNNFVDAKGILINQNKDTLLQFKTLHFGTGNFTFTPEKDKAYKALIVIADTILVESLPKPAKQGIVMHLTELDSAYLKLSVHSNSNFADNSVYMIIQSHKQVKSIQTNLLIHGETSFIINKKELTEGISCITITDSEKKPVCERLYFKQPNNKLNIEIVLDKKSYTSREKVSIELSTKSDWKNFTTANLSMSVFQNSPIQEEKNKDILSYLFLTSEIKGKVDSPEYYFNGHDTLLTEATDNLMMTQGWRKFIDSDTQLTATPSFEFIPEIEGHLIRGKIVDKRNGVPAKNIMTFLSVPGKIFQFKNSLSDSTGHILFSLPKFYDHNSMVLQTNNKTDSVYRIELENPFSFNPISSSISPLILKPQWQSDLLHHSINVQVENAYKTEEKLTLLAPVITDTLAFYGVPSKKYFLDDYTRFRTMEEVMREYVNDVLVRFLNGKFNFKVWNENFESYFDDNPLVLIDGIPVFNMNNIIAFDPLKIRKIEVVARKYFLGSLLNEGIISYSTYNGDLAGFELDPNSIVVDYDGLQRQREFYAPHYQTIEEKSSRLPDFRNVLIWDPTINIDGSGKTKISFYTSDVKGKFLINIQGINKEGWAGSTIFDFDVTN